MKKALVLIFTLLLCLAPLACACAQPAEVDWNAFTASVDGTAVAVDAGLDLGEILNQTILWIVRGLLAALISLVAYVLQKYVVPWLKEKRLFALAQKLVQAAEAELGRYTGAMKWEQVSEWLTMKGFSITSVDVQQAVQAAWLELNNKMVEIGLKGTTAAGMLETPADEPEDGETAEGDVFAGTDEPIKLE